MTCPLPRTMVLTIAIGLTSVLSGNAMASGSPWEKHRVHSNASDKCHAWSPGATDQIRSRVAGIENIGNDTEAVACVYEVTEDYYNPGFVVDQIKLYFRNGAAAAPATVSCTLLPGNHVAGFGIAVNEDVEIGAGSTGHVAFNGTWTQKGIGVNCSLPPRVTIAHSRLTFRNADD